MFPYISIAKKLYYKVMRPFFKGKILTTQKTESNLRQLNKPVAPIFYKDHEDLSRTMLTGKFSMKLFEDTSHIQPTGSLPHGRDHFRKYLSPLFPVPDDASISANTVARTFTDAAVYRISCVAAYLRRRRTLH